jgi:AraC-like DNA-binding protein
MGLAAGGVVTRWETDRSVHELMVRRASGPAGEVVRGYVGYEEWPGQPLTRRRVARPGMALILAFGDRIEVRDGGGRMPRSLGAFVAGPQSRFSVTGFGGHQHGVQVELSDVGAVALFGDVHDLSGAAIPVGEVLGGWGERLVGQLAEAPGWAARFAVLDGVFAGLPAGHGGSARVISPEVAWLRQRLAATDGRARVEPLMDETGWSRRVVTARFRSQFGVSPKTYARIVRFRRALRLLGRAGHDRTLADVAMDCGYYDQSHFTRDFVALAGCTPSAFRAETAGERDVRFFQDDEPAGSLR